MDTRPEDLLITPVIAEDRRIEYRASSVVSAMIRGGVLLLDEGNRMPERSWASLAPLMDERRYVESTLAAIKIHAHPDFRLCVTMNDDASVYELPGYVQSRLKPKIEIVRPPWEMQERIVRLKCPGVDDDLLRGVFEELTRRASAGRRDSIRDVLTLAEYAQKLRNLALDRPLERAIQQVLVSPDGTEGKKASGRSRMTLRAQCRNLVGIPSFHYDPLFARAVGQAIRQVRPEVIALELPEWLGGELDWALRCWPTPVGSNARDLIVPWIPGDSILEARRLARQLGIPVHLVDLTVVNVAGAEPPRERPVALLPGPEFAPRVGQAFQDAVDAVAEPPSTGDLAREAFMAERLDGADAPASPGAVGGRHGALDAARRTARTARFLQSAGAEAHTRPMPSSLARGLGIAPVDRALAISGRAVCRAPGVV
jgi:hypothetical protein